MSIQHSPEQRSRQIQRVAAWGAAVNLILAALKVGIGQLANSQALVADGLHSLSDLISDVMVFLAAKHSAKAADQEHPYGHARIETAFTVVLGALLILVAAGIGYDALQRLLHPGLLEVPQSYAIVAALVSVVANEALYHYTMWVGRRIRSNLLKANAWHHRSDSISSVVVLAGLVGTHFGLIYLDAVAAIAVAVMIARIGWSMAWHSFSELVDRGLDEDKVSAIRAAILDVTGVKSIHMLRTRQMGGDALVDVHVQVSPYLSVSEGHQISEFVRQTLLNSVDEVTDVTVHIDPEDDAVAATTQSLPLREEFLPRLQRQWAGILGDTPYEDVILHYLDGAVSVDLVLPVARMEATASEPPLAERLREAATDLPELGRVRVFYR